MEAPSSFSTTCIYGDLPEFQGNINRKRVVDRSSTTHAQTVGGRLLCGKIDGQTKIFKYNGSYLNLENCLISISYCTTSCSLWAISSFIHSFTHGGSGSSSQSSSRNTSMQGSRHTVQMRKMWSTCISSQIMYGPQRMFVFKDQH